MDVLRRRLECGIPPNLEGENILVEYETEYEQLEEEAVSEKAANIFKAGLAALAEEYTSTERG